MARIAGGTNNIWETIIPGKVPAIPAAILNANSLVRPGIAKIIAVSQTMHATATYISAARKKTNVGGIG